MGVEVLPVPSLGTVALTGSAMTLSTDVSFTLSMSAVVGLIWKNGQRSTTSEKVLDIGNQVTMSERRGRVQKWE